MIRLTITGNSAAANTSGLANDVAFTANTAAVLAATAPTDGLGHLIVITNNSATDYSGGGKTVSVAGKNADGQTITETITGPGSSVTTTTTKHFMSDIVVTPNFSRTTTDTFDIGWTAASVSAYSWVDGYPWHHNNTLGFGCIVDSGSPTYSVQHTHDGGITAFTHSVVTGKTQSFEGAYSTLVQGIRLTWSAAGQVTLHGRY